MTWIAALAKRGELRREVRRLREHLNTQMDITQRGNAAMKDVNSIHSKRRTKTCAWRSRNGKPSRGGARCASCRSTTGRSASSTRTHPGFSPVWEKAVKESEDELAESESGSMGSMLRRAFRPFAALGNGPRADKPAGASYDEAGSSQAPHHD